MKVGFHVVPRARDASGGGTDGSWGNESLIYGLRYAPVANKLSGIGSWCTKYSREPGYSPIFRPIFRPQNAPRHPRASQRAQVSAQRQDHMPDVVKTQAFVDPGPVVDLVHPSTPNPPRSPNPPR